MLNGRNFKKVKKVVIFRGLACNEKFVLNYIDSKKGILSSYTDITEYDGSAVGTTIYSIEAENPLIENEYKKLIFVKNN